MVMSTPRQEPGTLPGSAGPDVSAASVGDLFGRVTQDLSTLMRQEFDLAKAEIRQEATKSGERLGTSPRRTSRCVTMVGVELLEKVDSDPRDVSRVRRSVTSELRREGVPQDDLDVVALLVSELVTNAIRHGAPPVHQRAEHSDGNLMVVVDDAGENVPVPVEDTSWDASGGRGLHLGAALADGWGVSPNGRGKRVWFRVAISS